MVEQCFFRILVVGLVVGTGCTESVVVGANDEADDGADDGVDEWTSSDGTDDDGIADDGADDGSELAPFMSAEVTVDQAPVHRPTLGRWPAVAFDGSQYLVVWEDHRAWRPILYGGRVTANGTALDPYGFPILDLGLELGSGDKYFEPDVAFDGTNFLVITGVGNQIRGVRVSAAGELLDPEPIVIAAPDSTVSRPALAFDGEQYLVVWSQWSPDDAGIYRARVEPDGTVLDPDGVLVHPLEFDLTKVGVSFDGSNYLLSWTDFDVEAQSQLLHAGRVAPDGALIDEDPIQINPIGVGVDQHVGPAVGFDGTNHVIAWTTMGVNAEGWEEIRVLAGRVTPEGTLLDPDAIAVSNEVVEATSAHRLDMAAGDGRSVVVWSMDYGGEGGPSAGWVRTAEIATDGTASVHPADELTRGLEATLAVHPDGALVLWREGEDLSEDYPAIVGARLDGGGVPMAAELVSPASPASRQDVKAVASDGQSFFVLWTDTRDSTGEGRALYGTRLGGEGMPLDPEPIQLTASPADLADVVFDGANFVVTWVRFSGGEGDGDPFNTVRVSPAGERLDAEPLQPPLSHVLGRAASDGTHTLLVGEDSESADSVLAAVLLNQAGAVASEVVHVLDEGVGADPAASFDGIGYLVVWHDYEQIFGQRISKAGALVGPRFSIASGEFIYHLEVAAGGDNHLVSWQDEDQILVARVSADGQVLDPGGRLVVESGSANFPSIAFDGQTFIVAWRALSVEDDANSIDLFAAELSAQAELLRQFPISSKAEREGVPFLVSGDGRVFAAYARFMPGPPFDTYRAVARVLLPD